MATPRSARSACLFVSKVKLTLRYTGPLSAFEDRLEPAGTGFQGRSYLGGMELGRFELRRPSP